MDKESLIKVKDEIKELEKSIGIQEGFFEKLRKSESDWSFIIKLHAFFEAACTMLIAKALEKDEILHIIDKLPMSQSTHGKMAFVEGLSLLTNDSIKFIKKLSEIRNHYVHNIKSMSEQLEEYFDELDKSQKKQFIHIMGFTIADKLVLGGHKIEKPQFIKENPRVSIELGTLIVTFDIACQLALVKIEHQRKGTDKRAAEYFYSMFKTQ